MQLILYGIDKITLASPNKGVINVLMVYENKSEID